jgi:glycosyltransferase involved in cell wall biosynthesis
MMIRESHKSNTFVMVKSSIVVARYSEDVMWLKGAFCDDNVFIYNKGSLLKSSDLPRSWNLNNIPNIGRESHTYLHHIIKNYEKLADVTVFIQGHVVDHISNPDPVAFIWDIAKEAFEHGVSKNTFSVHPSVTGAPSPWFRVQEWKGSKSRSSGVPFGEWFSSFVGCEYPSMNDKFLWYGGALFAVHRNNILQHPKSFYQRLLSTVNDHPSPEEGHYMERSWYYIMQSRPDVSTEYIFMIISHQGNRGLWDKLIDEFHDYRHMFQPFIICADPKLKTEFIYNPKKGLVTVCCDDSYESLSEKVARGLKAVTTLVTPKHGVIKMDDDVILNISNFQKLLDESNLAHYHYIGVTVDGNRWCDFHKEKVSSEQHKEPVFIPSVKYCGGPLYLLSTKAVDEFLKLVNEQTYDMSHTNTFHLYEDVNMGLILSNAKQPITPRHAQLYQDDVNGVSDATYKSFLESSSRISAFHDKFHAFISRYFDDKKQIVDQHVVCTPLNTHISHDMYYNPNTSPLVNKPAPIKGQSNPFVVFLYEADDNGSADCEYSVVMPVHDQEDIIVSNIKSIIANTVGTFELLMVFDGCTDATEYFALEYFRSRDWKLKANIKRICLIHQKTSIFETACDNMLFRLSNGKYIVEIQADMQVKTYGYNFILSKPMRVWTDVIAVSGKAAHRFFKWLNGNGVGRIYLNEINNPLKLTYDDMNTFFEWETVNRGPLLFDSQKLRDMGYLDEQNFVLGNDDHDLMARAWTEKQWRCGYMPVEVYMPMERGTMRKEMKKSDSMVLDIRKQRSNGGFLGQLEAKGYKDRELVRHIVDDDVLTFGLQTSNDGAKDIEDATATLPNAAATVSQRKKVL